MNAGFVSEFNIGIWLMIIPISEMFNLNPFGALMCENEGQKVTGCKSFEFNFSGLICMLNCDPCPTGYSQMETFCRNISKNTRVSTWKHDEKIYPMKSFMCNEVKRQTARRSNFVCNRFLFFTLKAKSFHIMDLSNISQRVEINYGHRIYKLADFTKTRVLLALHRKKNNLILYNIEKKTEETVLDRVKVYDTARGETEGVVYVFGKSNKAKSKKSVWIISNSSEIKTIDVDSFKGNRFEVDAHEEIIYFHYFEIEVYNIRTNSKSIIATRHRVVSMTLEHVENILYIFTEKRWNRLILPNGEIEHLFEFQSDYVVGSLVNGNDFYLIYLDKSWNRELFKITLSEKEKKETIRTSILKSAKKAIFI